MSNSTSRNVWVIAASALALAACGQVRPGYVGLKVNQFGSGAGVSCDPLGVGTYFTPVGTHIEEYPVFTNTYTYSASPTEGNATNEEFNFQDQSGVAIAADIGVSYSADPERVCILFQKYRVGTDQLIAGPLRNEIRNELINAAAQMQAQDIYGPKKQDLLTTVQARTAAYFAPYGLRVEKLFWANNIRLPPSIQDQITARIANENAAQAAQAQIATVQAQAQQRIAEAQGEAQAIQIQAEALKTNPQYAELKAIEKWDGRLPTYMSSGPLPFIGRTGGEEK
jgi:regulator of protease activity HflC (stomatin/prohibitin superfamily)